MTALTIGNFDGVHLGHRALIEAARAAVGSGRVAAMVFDPHPRRVLAPDRPLRRLSTFEQRRGWLEAAGADEVIRLRPTPELLGAEPAAFVERLVAEHAPSHIVEGPDFRFGRGRSGSVQTLRDLGTRLGFAVIVIDPVEVRLLDGHEVRAGSGVVRRLVVRGRVRDARRVLGRPYEMICPVVAGDRRGRAIGMPTVNLDHGDRVVPADGIYAGTATDPEGAEWAAAVSVGTKPTFGAAARTVEAHLVGWEGPPDTYGWTIRLRFLDWLRDQVPFEDVEALVAQMRRDVERTTRLCAR